jgi:FtsH-binding integral membrane protein
MTLAMVWTDTRDYLEPLRRALVLPVFSFIAGVSMDAVTKSQPPAYDFYLYAFDSGLGITPGASVAKLFDALPWLGIAASVTYALLLLFPTLYDAWGLRRGLHSSLMTAFAVGGVCGFIFYQIFRASGQPTFLDPASQLIFQLRANFSSQCTAAPGRVTPCHPCI